VLNHVKNISLLAEEIIEFLLWSVSIEVDLDFIFEAFFEIPASELDYEIDILYRVISENYLNLPRVKLEKFVGTALDSTKTFGLFLECASFFAENFNQEIYVEGLNLIVVECRDFKRVIKSLWRHLY